jgi:MazG family protein
MNDAEMIECREPSRQMERLMAIMNRLRKPHGCPWDAEQTHQSLIPNMIEEAYELVETIQMEDWNHMREELGDVLLQVVFHAEIAQEQGRFQFNDVAEEVCEKMIRRHPHVFGHSQAETSDEVLAQWDQIKRQEKGDQKSSYLHGVGKGLPPLMRAWKLQKKAAKVGFDWPDAAGALEKVQEELGECRDVLDLPENDSHLTEELGDLLFEKRFYDMEKLLDEQGTSLDEADLEAMEACWNRAKGVS